MPVVNFTDVETSDFEALPAGRYLVRVETTEEREGQKAPYLAVTYEVIEPEEYAGRKLFDNLSFSQKALFRFKGFLQAIGYTEEDLAEEFTWEEGEFNDAELEVQVYIDTWEGKQTNKVRKHFVA